MEHAQESLSPHAIQESLRANPACREAMKIQAIFHGRTAKALNFSVVPEGMNEPLILVSHMGLFYRYFEPLLGRFRYVQIPFGRTHFPLQNTKGEIISYYSRLQED
jgi:hypothetical protein